MLKIYNNFVLYLIKTKIRKHANENLKKMTEGVKIDVQVRMLGWAGLHYFLQKPGKQMYFMTSIMAKTEISTFQYGEKLFVNILSQPSLEGGTPKWRMGNGENRVKNFGKNLIDQSGDK